MRLYRRTQVNKAELIDALAARLGDKKTAAAAVDGLVDVVVRSVHKGEKVTITGFGVFEKRARAARTARNPRTGEAVRVKKTTVPAFRAGMNFKEVVSGAKKLPRATSSRQTKPATGSGRNGSSARGASSSRPAASRAAISRATTGSAATRTAAARSTAAKSASPAKAGATKASPAKASPAKASPAKTAAKSAATAGSKSAASSGTKAAVRKSGKK
ncbi:MAG: HU family DNA-binding protein [Pseudonocardiaceae bacterium]|nr:HU family DNA-binding protein [Pseudonocardiaceae bacterium]